MWHGKTVALLFYLTGLSVANFTKTQLQNGQNFIQKTFLTFEGAPVWCFYPGGDSFPASGEVCDPTNPGRRILGIHLAGKKSVAYYTVPGDYFGDGNGPSIAALNGSSVYLCGSGIQNGILPVSFCVLTAADDTFPGSGMCWFSKVQPAIADGCYTFLGRFSVFTW